MSAWPGTLPTFKYLRDFKETPPDNLIRTQMDSGADKIRRRTTANPREVKGSLRLTKTEVAALDTFYMTTLVSGSLSFTHNHPRTDASETWRFTKRPEYNHRTGDFYLVPLELEIV